MTTGLQATIDKSALLRLLSVVREAASYKAGALPVYQMVRLDASAGYLRATCFNGDWMIGGSIPAQSMDTWSAHVPVRTIIDVVNTMETPITMTIDENQLLLNCKVDRARINGSADALPVVAAVDNDEALVLTGKDIQYLSRIDAFASTDDGRPILQAIHLSIVNPGDNSRLRAETADGIQAARVFVNLPYKPLAELNVLLPAPFFAMIVKAVSEKDQVKVLADKNRMTFAVTGDAINFTFSSSLMDGTFPDLDEILKIEKAVRTTFTFEMPALQRFAKRARAFSKKDAAMVIQIKDIGGALRARAMAKSDEIGETRDSIALTTSEGSEMLFAVNADRIVTVCEAVDGPAPVFKLVGHNAPILVRCPKSDMILVTMPMFIPDVDRAKMNLFDDLPVAFPLLAKAMTDVPVPV
jgi:DNA polymerase III sliding clamp (beta) subunit (PCNA family)